MRFLFALVFLCALVSMGPFSQTAAAGEPSFTVAKMNDLLHSGSVKNMTPLSKFAQGTRNCSLNCGTNSGSAQCSANQTCDCSCNRQPICECR
jgi:hypothetical protein